MLETRNATPERSAEIRRNRKSRLPSTLMRRPPTPLPVFTVILLITAIAMPTGSSVMCIGPDGHVAIEPIHQVTGCEALGLERLAFDDQAFIETKPDRCVDLPLETTAWQLFRLDEAQGPFNAIALAWHALSYPINLGSDASPKAFRISGRLHGDRVPEPMLSLRSIVLLL